MEHAITEEKELNFIVDEIKRLEGILTSPEEERGQIWRAHLPYHRLLCTLMDDDVRKAYLKQADPKTRMELDGQNSDSREPTAYELMSDK